jgi:hypothetical protein
MNVQDIVLAALAILLAGFLVRYRKWLILNAYRTIYGSYSSGFIGKFKKFTGQNPYPLCIKEDLADHLLPLFSKKEDTRVFLTGKAIRFEDVPAGMTLASLIKIKGKPDCFQLPRSPFGEIIIAGYEGQVSGCMGRKLFFFHPAGMFLSEYRFDNPGSQVSCRIAGEIAGQYLETHPPEGVNFLIRDSQSSLISYYNDGFTLTVRYYFGYEGVNRFFSGRSS